MRDPFERSHGVEPDVDRALVRLLLGRGDPRLQRDRPRRRLDGLPVDDVEQFGHRLRDGGRDPQVEGLLRRQGGVLPVQARVLVALVQPTLDRGRADPGSSWSGSARSIGFSGPVCDPGETAVRDAAYIRSRPAPLARGRCRPHPRDHGDVQVHDLLRQRDAVLIDRARRVDLQHHDRAVGLSRCQPIRQVVARSGRSMAPSTLSTTTCVPAEQQPKRGLATGRGHRNSTGRGLRGASGPIVPAGLRGILPCDPMAPASRPRRPDPRPLNDRLVFKPLALLLLVPVIMLSGALMAFVLAPPFVGAALGRDARRREARCRWAPTSRASPASRNARRSTPTTAKRCWRPSSWTTVSSCD